MRITLITDFVALSQWTQALDQAIHRWGIPRMPTALWVRNLPAQAPTSVGQALKRLQAQHSLSLEYSWAHRGQAPHGATVHVPDALQLREESQSWHGPRILSLHDLKDADQVLSTQGEDQVLLAPWRQPISKAHVGPTLDQRAARTLASNHPDRVHVVGGLRPEDYHDLRDQGFASMALLGAFTASPAACWQALTELS